MADIHAQDQECIVSLVHAHREQRIQWDTLVPRQSYKNSVGNYVVTMKGSLYSPRSRIGRKIMRRASRSGGSTPCRSPGRGLGAAKYKHIRLHYACTPVALTFTYPS